MTFKKSSVLLLLGSLRRQSNTFDAKSNMMWKITNKGILALIGEIVKLEKMYNFHYSIYCFIIVI